MTPSLLVIDGYSLVYNKNGNSIVISLPQTSTTVISTYEPIRKRNTDVSKERLMLILAVTKMIFEEDNSDKR